MDDSSRLIIGTITAIILLFFKAFFTVCSTSIFEVNEAKLKKLSAEDKKTKRAYKIYSKPNKLLFFLSVIKSLLTVSISIVVAITYFGVLNNTVFKFISNGNLRGILSILICIFATSFVLVPFGDVIPKKIQIKSHENFAIKTAGFLSVVKFILSPVTAIIYFIALVFGKVFSINLPDDKETVTEEEILMMVDAVNETGGIEESQVEMINNIFEFGDLEVSDIMTHRTDMVAVEKNDSISNVVMLAKNEGFSRIPVYEGTIDNVCGVIYVKDLLVLIGCEDIENQTISEFMRDILFVPATNKCSELFKELMSIKAQIAIAVDEYGGTAGLISMEDLIESIVGNIQDEYDNEIEEIVKISDDKYELSGNADPNAVCEALEIELLEDHDYDTISGFLIDLLGYIPSDDDDKKNVCAEYQGVIFTVLESDEKRILKILAEKKKEEV